MSFARVFIILTVVVFGGIFVVAVCKRKPPVESKNFEKTIEVPIQNIVLPVENVKIEQPQVPVKAEQNVVQSVPEIDSINLLFMKQSPLKIVETITYKSSVAWKHGRAAWLVDYASHYRTPLQFIARSLNEKPDYTPKAISDGQQFNVLSTSCDFYFHMIVDVSTCKLCLYYVIPKTGECELLKTYTVGLGRKDESQPSGTLTPFGTYLLGGRIATFQPKMMGTHKNKKVELISVFGTRWIPFEKEVADCTAPAKGYGLHGTPWSYNEDTQSFYECNESIGKYESDGCIRLATKDIEELYAVITTRKAIVEIVNTFQSSHLQGKSQGFIAQNKTNS